MGDNLKNNEAEFREEQSEKVLEFLERSGAYKYFQDLLEGGEEVPDFDKFRDFLIRINGIARDIPISQRKFDGVNVGLSGFVEDVIVPKHEDKEGLLQYAYESIRDIDKEDAKYMLPAVINAVHLFNDGNGRTSRVLHLLLSEYKSEEEFLEEAKKALGKDGRFDSLDINPSFIEVQTENITLQNHGWIFNGKEYEGEKGVINPLVGVFTRETRKFDEQNPNTEVAQDFFNLYNYNARYGMECISELMGDEGIKSLLVDYNGSKMVSALKMLDMFKKEDWEKMIDNFWKLKKEQVESLVDAFAEPEKHKTKWKGETETVRDYFIEEIKRQKSG